MRGLYDKPNLNALTGKLTQPDPRSIIDGLAPGHAPERRAPRPKTAAIHFPCSVHGPSITTDLRDGLSTPPIWMRLFLRDLIPAPDIPPNMDPANNRHHVGQRTTVG